MALSKHPSKLEAASLYFGKVMHARLKPTDHRFTYNVFSLLIDLDRLEEANSKSWFFSTNRANVVSFKEIDHGPRDGTSLRAHIDNLLENGGLPKPARIELWCNPRVFGYTFNPLSVYFCYDGHGEVFALVYQVHNTFGQSHTYVAPHTESVSASTGSIRQSADKCFYVSPFLDMEMRYDFRINPPEEMLKIRILESDSEGPILAATFHGKHKALNFRHLFLGIGKTAGLTWKIMAGIHYEAFKLWLKGVGLRPRPVPPKKASYVQQEGRTVAGE